MKTASANYEQFTLRIDQIADARGITFSERLNLIRNAMEHLKTGEVLTVYCSDLKNKKIIPKWLQKQGLIYLGMVNMTGYFKILLIKGK